MQPDDPPSKRAILSAAVELFVYKGLCETSVRDIAKASGYTNPALFKFFDSKEALARYLFECCFRWHGKRLAKAVNAPESFEEKLSGFSQACAVAISEDLESLLYVQENLRHFWSDVAPRLRDISMLATIRCLFDEGRSQGKVTRDIPLSDLVSAAAGVVTQFARMAYFGDMPRVYASQRRALEKVLTQLLRP